MKVIVLGTQSPYATFDGACPGFFICDGDDKIMLDCGSGTTRHLVFPYHLENLHIFISHFHRDHYNGIYNFQYASHVLHNQGELQKPIEIHLPMVATKHYEDIVSEEYAFANYNRILDELEGVRVGKFKVSFCLTGHTTESYAFKVQDDNHTVVYTSDISFSAKDDIVRFVQNADLLICESSLLENYGFSEINSHITAKQAAIIAKEANVKKLMLTHFWPSEIVGRYVAEAKTVFENVVAANEGDIIDVDEIKIGCGVTF